MTPKKFHDVVSSFPETELTKHYGEPSYKSFGKFLTRLRADNNSVVLGSVDFDERDMLIEADPDTFHVTDHYKGYPYVLARLARLDEKTLRGYLTRQWRKNAPAKWLKAYDAGDPLPPVVIKPPKPRSRKSSGRTR